MDMQLLLRRPNKEIHRRGDECVKLFNDCVPAADVLREAMNQAFAEAAGLPVPRLREVTKLGGRWAIIYDFVEGETLLQRMEAAPGDRQWMELFVQLQMETHAAQIPQLQRQRDKLHRKISAAAAHGLDATTRYELHVRLDTIAPNQKVCHGDFVPSNILLREGRAFIIDWAHLTQGNAAADAANTYLTLEKRGYSGLASSYLKLYCELSDTARQYVAKWIPIVAGAALDKCPAEERGFYLARCEGLV